MVNPEMCVESASQDLTELTKQNWRLLPFDRQGEANEYCAAS